jgi:hypothetical protein
LLPFYPLWPTGFISNVENEDIHIQWREEQSAILSKFMSKMLKIERDFYDYKFYLSLSLCFLFLKLFETF